MPRAKKINLEPNSTTNDSFISLPRRDAAAIEFARAYIAHHGQMREDVIKDSVVGPANKLADLLGWDDHL